MLPVALLSALLNPVLANSTDHDRAAPLTGGGPVSLDTKMETNITRATAPCLREFAPRAEIYFQRVVSEEQIDMRRVSMQPFDGDGVEVDAITPVALQGMISSDNEQHCLETA